MNLPDFKIELDDSGREYYNRILIGTATTGLVRMEWVGYRFGSQEWVKNNFVYVILAIVVISVLPMVIDYGLRRWRSARGAAQT